MKEIEDLGPVIHRVETGLRIRQKPEGSWEFYGPLAPASEVLVLHNRPHAQRHLLTEQTMLALSEILSLEYRSDRYFRFKKTVQFWLYRELRGKPYPSLEAVVRRLIALELKLGKLSRKHIAPFNEDAS